VLRTTPSPRASGCAGLEAVDVGHQLLGQFHLVLPDLTLGRSDASHILLKTAGIGLIFSISGGPSPEGLFEHAALTALHAVVVVDVQPPKTRSSMPAKE